MAGTAVWWLVIAVVVCVLAALALRSVWRQRSERRALHELGLSPLAQPRKRSTVRLITAYAVGLLLIGVAGVGLWWQREPVSGEQKEAAANSSSCTEPGLRVAAAPEIAPAVQAAAKTLGPDGDGCYAVAVTAEEPAVTRAAEHKPDVWIPSSSAWLTIAAADGAAYTTDGAPLARSPIVLAAPEPIAAKYAKDGRGSWAALVDGVAQHQIPAVTMPDPLHSTVGLLSVHAVHQAMTRTTPDPGIAQLRALTLRSKLTDAAVDPSTLLPRAVKEADALGVFPTTAQQIRAAQQNGTPVSLISAAPADGAVDADYPYALAPSVAQPELAAKLKAAITPQSLADAGFATEATPQAMPMPTDAAKLLGPALQWSQYKKLNYQVLLLVDSSGSMHQPVTDKAKKATTKAALLRESGLAASLLFGEDTAIGMWFFGTENPASPAHTEVLPLGPLTEPIDGKTRRTALTSMVSAYQPPQNAGTPLYQTVLDGTAAMRAKAKPGTATLVVVLTDGRDEQSRFSMPEQQFMAKLTAAQDPTRPVPIMGVGYGADADMNALTAMAKATGGRALAAKDPAELASAIAQAFLAAHAPA
ncbi:substrate-binding domain-containing protein [Actinoplanes sp. NPDC051859]|uniref:substrate-binding domain-containing protein n=1 Tax=Actinoplanes sp. NPDC051859 TaxID=3363909 RepID=UPI0037A09B86